MRNRTLIAAIGCVGLVLTACGGSASPAANTGGPKPHNGVQLVVGHTGLTDPTNEFRKAWYGAIQNAVEKAGAKYEFCSGNADATTQANCVSQFVAQNVDAVVIWPVDVTAIVSSIQALNQANIPVFQYLSTIPASSGVKIAATVAFADYDQGVLDGTEMVKDLQAKYGSAKGTVLEVQGQITTSSAQQRGAGFHSVVDKYPDIKVVSKPADWDGSKATTVIQTWFTANPNTDGIYMHSSCDYLPAAQAALIPMGKYVKEGQPGHVILVGTDGCNSDTYAVHCGYMELAVDAGLNSFTPLLSQIMLDYLEHGKTVRIGETFNIANGRTATITNDPTIAGPIAVIKPLPITQANASDPTLAGNSVQSPPNGTSTCTTATGT